MKYYILSALLLSTIFGFAQQKDHKKQQVLLASINKTYEGETKKGLAHGIGKAKGDTDSYEGSFKKGYPHGEGVYIWGNGNKYTGQFSKGKMNGKGELIIKRKNNLPDNIQKGYFKNNEYIGLYKDPYKIISDGGIRNIDFNKNAGQIYRVKFEIYSNGKPVKSGVSIRDKNNTILETINGYLTLTNVNFPLERVEVSFSADYTSYTLLFDLYEKGNWNVIISI